MAQTSPQFTVLITGSSRGIGLALVEQFQTLGYRVIAAARNPNTAEKLRELAPYKIVTIDVREEESIVAAAKALEGETVDILINNAGVVDGGSLTTTPKESLMKQFEVNAVGPFLMTREFQPHLKAAVATHGIAKVINMSSMLGSVTLSSTKGMFGPLYGYRGSKAALNNMNASLALELKDVGIAAIVLHPGVVATDMMDNHGDINATQSAAGMVKVITEATMETTGAFLDYEGKTMPW